jgi:ADP-ribose pyrophosphatase
MASKIPPTAKMVFKGKLFEIWQWEQEMFDGSFTTFEVAKRADSVVVIPLLPNGNILLERQRQPGKEAEYISLPGGMVDEGEDPLTAALRELSEETGYTTDLPLRHWFTVPPHFRVERRGYVYFADAVYLHTAQHVDRGGEHIELFEVSFDDFLRIVFDENFQQIEVSWKVALALLNPEKMRELRELCMQKNIATCDIA